MTKSKNTALSETPPPNSKVDKLLLLDKITPKDLEDLNGHEHKYFEQYCNKWLGGEDCPERNSFLDKIELILSADTNDQIWERNHATITGAIADFISKHGAMPAKNTIVRSTGLSRPTVIKHLREYQRKPAFNEQMEQFKFMAPKMLANIYKTALKGDMRAARLYLETVGTTGKKQPDTIVTEQKNYIQINNTILSQENLKRLTNEQLDQIERIVNNKRLMEVGEKV